MPKPSRQTYFTPLVPEVSEDPEVFRRFRLTWADYIRLLLGGRIVLIKGSDGLLSHVAIEF